MSEQARAAAEEELQAFLYLIHESLEPWDEIEDKVRTEVARIVGNAVAAERATWTSGAPDVIAVEGRATIARLEAELAEVQADLGVARIATAAAQAENRRLREAIDLAKHTADAFRQAQP